MFKKLEYYFLSDNSEEITLHERLWFYGFYTLVIIILTFVVIGFMKGV